MLKEITVIMLFGKENVKMDNLTKNTLIVVFISLITTIIHLIDFDLPIPLNKGNICHINKNGEWQSDCFKLMKGEVKNEKTK